MSDTAKQNVVSLEDYAQTTRGTGNSACAQVLDAVRKLVEKKLARNVSTMMGKVDDALFARAEMAESSSLQTQYHQAMQTLRDSRKDVEEGFIKRFKHQFNEGIPRQTQLGDSFGLECSGAGSGDENRAIARMVHKTREHCAQLLPALDRRIGFLLNDPDLEQWQNPLAPEAICAAFHGAAGNIETGSEIRLLVLKLFDEHVASNMDELYRELDQQLVKMGVMPDIKGALSRDAGPEAGADSVETLLSAPQQTIAPSPAPKGQQTGADRKIPPQSNDMSIDMVAMIFDYILNDRNIAVPMRALLGRLQIPLVKVAMLEREFFSRKAHPARQLLNGLAATAMGWDEQLGHEDPSYRKVEAIVQTIVDEFESDISLFSKLLDDLETFQNTEQQQTSVPSTRDGELVGVRQAVPRARWRPRTLRRIKRHSGAKNDLYTARVSQLSKGTWVEFLTGDGNTTRAKLSWISPIHHTYLFTDPQGVKVGHYRLEELAELMRCARANIIGA